MNKHAKHQAGRRSATEWRRLIERWERSAYSADTFARKHRLSKKTLLWWRWRLRSSSGSLSETSPPEGLTFVPLSTSRVDQMKSPDTESRWVIETRTGVRVEMSGSTALVVDGLATALDRMHGRS